MDAQIQQQTYDKLIGLLNAGGAEYRLIEHAAEGRTDVVSGLRGNVLAQAAKCIILMVKLGKKDKRFVLAVIPGDAKLTPRQPLLLQNPHTRPYTAP